MGVGGNTNQMLRQRLAIWGEGKRPCERVWEGERGRRGGETSPLPSWRRRQTAMEKKLRADGQMANQDASPTSCFFFLAAVTSKRLCEVQSDLNLHWYRAPL